MSRKLYTDEFLISELHRFVAENGRVPSAPEMNPKKGYPSYQTYQNYFGSWNKALEAAGLEVNLIIHELDGSETCSHCGKRADEIVGFKQWVYPDGVRYCEKHGNSGIGGKPDYVTGILDINISTGLGRAGEICVIKTLEIGKEHDCNRESCHYSIDMYHDEYGRIDVKTCLLSDNGRSHWVFNFPNKPEIKTFICLGLSFNRSDVKHVWIVFNNSNKRSLSVTNSFNSLLKNKKYEVNPQIYDDAWQDMLLNYTDGKCKVFGKKDVVSK